MNIGIAVKEARTNAGLNQKEFAEKIEVTQGYLSQIENGHRNPTFEILEKTSKASNIPLPLLIMLSTEVDDIREDRKESFILISSPLKALIRSII